MIRRSGAGRRSRCWSFSGMRMQPMVEHESDDLETEEAVEGASSVSRVLSCAEGFLWQDRARRTYKEDAQSNWRGVTRTSLVGGSDEIPVPFQLRYFEVEAGGYSSREKHAHQHVVVVVRGKGSVVLVAGLMGPHSP